MITIGWVQFVWLVGLFLGWTSLLMGGIYVLTRLLIKGTLKEFSDRLKTTNDRISSAEKKLEDLDKEFKTFLLQLPHEYQRRDDSIREWTVFMGKLDTLYEILTKRLSPNA